MGRLPLWVFALALLVLLVIMLWLPFGLTPTGLIEEWSLYQAFDKGQSFLHADFLISQPNRLFLLLSYAIGYWLTPDSFVGLNLVHLLFFLGKGVLLYALLRQLIPENPGVALVAAVLFMVYPADIGLFELRVTSYHAAVFFYLLAAYLLVVYWQRPAIPVLIGMWLAQVLGLGTYEVAYPLIAATPVILLALPRKGRRQLMQVIAAWYSVPLMMLVWIVTLFSEGRTYQVGLLQQSTSQPTAIPEMLHNLARAFARHFFEGWTEFLRQLNTNPLYLYTALLIALAAAAVVWLHMQRANQHPSGSVYQYGVLIAAGLVIIALGFLPFVPTPQGATNERVFLFSSTGAALSISAALHLLSQIFQRKAVFIISASTLIGMATFGALNLHQYMTDLSLVEQHMLAGIATQVPQIKDGTLLLIFDDANQLRASQWTFGGSSTTFHLLDALRYLYANPNLVAAVCYPEAELWGATKEGCDLRNDGVTFWAGGPLFAYPYDKVVALSYQPSGKVVVLDQIPYLPQPGAVGYDPRRLIDTNAAPPRRVQTLFTPDALQIQPISRAPREAVYIEFDQPIAGLGWLDPEGSLRWTNATTSTIYTWLESTHNYQIEFRVVSALTPDILDSLMLTVNHQPTALTRRTDESGATILRGLIPREVIATDPDATLLTFHVKRVISPQSLGNSDDVHLLGVRFDWLRIQPMEERVPVDTVQLTFDQPIPGLGWSDAEDGQRWMDDTTSTINLRLRSAYRYHIAFRVVAALTPDILDSLSLTVNDQPIALTRRADESGATVLSGDIPHEVVAANPDNTLLTFHINRVASPQSLGINEDTRALGVRFDWLHIQAVTVVSTPPPPPHAPVDSVQMEFDEPVPGEGWAAPESSLQKSLCWMTATTATINRWLQAQHSYQVEFRVVSALTPDTLDSLTLTVNDVPITLTRRRDQTGATILNATIPREVVSRNTTNTLFTFRINRVMSPQSLGIGADTRLLGVQFDWLRVRQLPSN
ncbi:MAG: hypothetical protein IT324_32245 [Anaerolineae bacterium]|nr:hypothetical protein [Anaerolineae bacterium]